MEGSESCLWCCCWILSTITLIWIPGLGAGSRYTGIGTNSCKIRKLFVMLLLDPLDRHSDLEKYRYCSSVTADIHRFSLGYNCSLWQGREVRYRSTVLWRPPPTYSHYMPFPFCVAGTGSIAALWLQPPTDSHLGNRSVWASSRTLGTTIHQRFVYLKKIKYPFLSFFDGQTGTAKVPL